MLAKRLVAEPTHVCRTRSLEALVSTIILVSEIKEASNFGEALHTLPLARVEARFHWQDGLALADLAGSSLTNAVDESGELPSPTPLFSRQ